jgi:hypothetical protein
VCVTGLILVITTYLALRLEIEPFWIAIVGLAAFLVQLVVRKFPIVLMVGMIYIGTFKTQAAAGVSPKDPTLITAVLLYVAVGLRILLSASGHAKPGLRDLFAGQIPGIAACCLLFVVIALSSMYSPARDIGQQKILRLFAFDLPLVVVPVILLRTDRDVRSFLILCMLGSFLLALRAVNRTTHPTAEMLMGQDDPTEIGEGALMGIAALSALYYPFRERRWFDYAMVVLVIILTFGVISSVSRSAILSFLGILIASLIFLRKKLTARSQRRIFISVVAMMIFAPIALTLIWQLPSTHAKAVVKSAELSAVIRGVPPPGTAGQRYSFTESAWNAFLNKPLLGWGAGGWSTLWHLDDGRVVTYPHDFILEIAAEQGLAGLLILAALILIIARNGWKIAKDPQHRYTFILPLITFTLLGNAVTGQVDDRLMWALCGMIFALDRMVTQRSKPAVTVLTWRPSFARPPIIGS